MVDGNDVYNMAWNDSPLLRRCCPASRSILHSEIFRDESLTMLIDRLIIII